MGWVCCGYFFATLVDLPFRLRASVQQLVAKSLLENPRSVVQAFAQYRKNLLNAKPMDCFDIINEDHSWTPGENIDVLARVYGTTDHCWWFGCFIA